MIWEIEFYQKFFWTCIKRCKKLQDPAALGSYLAGFDSRHEKTVLLFVVSSDPAANSHLPSSAAPTVFYPIGRAFFPLVHLF